MPPGLSPKLSSAPAALDRCCRQSALAAYQGVWGRVIWRSWARWSRMAMGHRSYGPATRSAHGSTPPRWPARESAAAWATRQRSFRQPTVASGPRPTRLAVKFNQRRSEGTIRWRRPRCPRDGPIVLGRHPLDYEHLRRHAILDNRRNTTSPSDGTGVEVGSLWPAISAMSAAGILLRSLQFVISVKKNVCSAEDAYSYASSLATERCSTDPRRL